MFGTKTVGGFPCSNSSPVSVVFYLLQACGIYLETRAEVDTHNSIESGQRSVLSEMLFTSSRYLHKCIRTEEMYVVCSLLTPSCYLLSQPPAICGLNELSWMSTYRKVSVIWVYSTASNLLKSSGDFGRNSWTEKKTTPQLITFHELKSWRKVHVQNMIFFEYFKIICFSNDLFYILTIKKTIKPVVFQYY